MFYSGPTEVRPNYLQLFSETLRQQNVKNSGQTSGNPQQPDRGMKKSGLEFSGEERGEREELEVTNFIGCKKPSSQ